MPTLESFEAHGFVKQGESGKEAYGKCPFCFKDSHFYVNKEKLCYDCKRCGESGGFSKFLKRVTEENEKAMDDAAWKALAIDRGLPRAALQGWGIGYAGSGNYTLPVFDSTGQVWNIKRFKLAGKLFGTPAVENSLFGLQYLSTVGPVFLTEGEWDAVALRYLLTKVGAEGTVVAVPGATQFPTRWTSTFHNRSVVAVYDLDEAGEKGEKLCESRIGALAKRLDFVKWPRSEQPGFDTRDFVCRAIKEKKLKEAWQTLQTYITAPVAAVGSPAAPQNSTVAPVVTPMTYPTALATYNQWLSLTDTDAIKVMFGTVFANRLDGDPVWLFLVGPPGSAKSELLMSLTEAPEIVAKSTLTSASLISGWQLGTGGQDHSLIPQLNQKVLIVKDFTAVLSAAAQERDTIFGVLRDAFDGKIEKSFGTGVRAYKSKFGVIAGVTPKINDFATMHQSLGERFLKYKMDEDNPDAKIRAAIANIDSESSMRAELQRAAAGVLANAPGKPAIPPSFVDKTVALARYCALLRGVVDRERYSQIVTHNPTTEVGTRPAKQLTKMAIGLAMVDGRMELNDDDYRIVRDMAISSCPDRVERVVAALAGKKLTHEELAKETRLPSNTLTRVTNDLFLLRTLRKEDKKWCLSEEVEEYIARGKIYA